MKFTYPVLVEKGNDKQAWGMVVPDIPGCFSAADNEQDIVPNAREAILLQLSELDKLPEPSPLAKINSVKFDTVALVDVDLADIEGPAKRINITIPANVLAIIDSEAKKRGVSRSNYLAESALHEAGR